MDPDDERKRELRARPEQARPVRRVALRRGVPFQLPPFLTSLLLYLLLMRQPPGVLQVVPLISAGGGLTVGCLVGAFLSADDGSRQFAVSAGLAGVAAALLLFALRVGLGMDGAYAWMACSLISMVAFASAEHYVRIAKLGEEGRRMAAAVSLYAVLIGAVFTLRSIPWLLGVVALQTLYAFVTIVEDRPLDRRPR